jgi:thymidylate synthase (FAD)
MPEKPSNQPADELLSLYFPVLDFGFVALVDYMGSDEAVEQAARVSYGFGTRQRSQTRGLLRYLRRHAHTTPSEMVELKFHCCMPMFVARQWIRHRTASVNEYSGRYSLIPMVFYSPPAEQFQIQNSSNKQGRADQSPEEGVYHASLEKLAQSRRTAQDLYEWMTSKGVARELARIDLPLSTYTQWYWKIDLHNLLHFLTLRVDAHAQWEIREYALAIARILKRVAPLSFEAWVDYDLCAAKLSRLELRALRLHVSSSKSGIQSTGQVTSRERLIEGGLSEREVDELLVKLSPGAEKEHDFELNLGAAKSGDHFEALFRARVPSEDQS